MAEPDFSKIKRNVGRMIDGGASESEIETYLGSEGVTVEQLRAAPAAQEQPTVSTGEDMLRSAGTGLLDAATGFAGLPGDVRDLHTGVLSWAAGKLGMDPEKARSALTTAGNVLLPYPTSRDVRGKVTEALPNIDYTPQTTAGKYARTTASFAPAALFPGSAVQRVGQVVLPGLASELAGQMTEGTPYEDAARLGGALVGGVGASGLSRAVTPFAASASKTRAAARLRAEGVQPTAGQATGSQRLRYFESEMGAGATEAALERQAEQFTAAALRRAGVRATRATPDVMDDTFRAIGNRFDDLAARSRAPLDTRLQHDLAQAVDDYEQVAGAVAPVVRNAAVRVFEVAGRNGGLIQGQAYQNIRSWISKNIARADGPTRMALRDVQEAIDDAIQRHMSRQMLNQWRTVRREYRNLITIESALGGAGEQAASGLISPARLRQAAIQTQGKRSYIRGRNDFADLAMAGNEVLTPLPNSGTPGRLRAQGVSNAVGAGIGAMLGGGLGGSPGAALGAMGGAVAPRALGWLAMSRPGQAYLGNQLLPRQPFLAPPATALMAAPRTPYLPSREQP